MADIFQTTFPRYFLERISIKISLKFVAEGPLNNIPALVQIMAWRRQGDKPLFEPMMADVYASLSLNKLSAIHLQVRTSDDEVRVPHV